MTLRARIVGWLCALAAGLGWAWFLVYSWATKQTDAP